MTREHAGSEIGHGPGLTFPEVRAVLRLANDLHGIPDAQRRREHLLASLCQLVGAGAGRCVVHREELRPHEPIVVSVLVGEDRDAPEKVEGDPSIDSNVPLEGREARATVSLSRRGPQFLPHHQMLVKLVHHEMRWLYRPDARPAAMPPPRDLGLPRRLRQTLEHLLDGQAEKQIALLLGISQNTVHHYAKELHRRFHASSRSELMALWISR